MPEGTAQSDARDLAHAVPFTNALAEGNLMRTVIVFCVVLAVYLLIAFHKEN